jgi:hypothetical protein
VAQQHCCFVVIACSLPLVCHQVNNLREIQALRRLSPHSQIIKLIEVLYDQPTGRLALVFELMERNIYELIRGRRHYLAENRVRSYMYQLIKAMDHMHRNGIFHRDIKPVRKTPYYMMGRFVLRARFICRRKIFWWPKMCSSSQILDLAVVYTASSLTLNTYRRGGIGHRNAC